MAAPRIVCIGGATIDTLYRLPEPLRPGTSNPAHAARSFGGVARNVAENLARLGAEVSLVTLVGDDAHGRAIRDHLDALAIGNRHVATLPGRTTAEYVAVLPPDGDLALGLAAMEIFEDFTTAHLDAAAPELEAADRIVADCNLPAPVLAALVARHASKLAVDAVSTPKVRRLPPDLRGTFALFVNQDEAAAYLGREGLSPEEAAGALLARGAARVVLTLGAAGLLAADDAAMERVHAVPARMVDATGAGDALIAATLAHQAAGHSLAEAARIGALAAALTVEQAGSVRSDLSPALLDAARERIPARSARTRPTAAVAEESIHD